MTIPDSQYNKMVEKIMEARKLLVFKLRYEALKKLILNSDRPVDSSSVATIEVLIPEE